LESCDGVMVTGDVNDKKVEGFKYSL
jgi:hypothetical protein